MSHPTTSYNARRAVFLCGGAALTGGAIMTANALAAGPQGAYSSGYGMGSDMMGDHGDGWMDGGYGGMWLPVLLVIVVAGLVAWIVARKKK